MKYPAQFVSLILLSTVMFLGGCAKDPSAVGPTSDELRNRFRTELPAYVTLPSFDLQVSENVGDKVEPVFKSRFKASLRLDADTYTETSREDGAIFIAPHLKTGTKRDIYGKALSTLKAGSWQIGFEVDNNPLRDMGQPRDFFSGGVVIVKGSAEETAFREKQRKERREQEDLIVGKWSWFNGDIHTFLPQGKIAGDSNSNWTLLDSGKKLYRIVWGGKWIDTVTISPDKRTLTGTNQTGTRITGNKIQ